jgi:hypothetical protein
MNARHARLGSFSLLAGLAACSGESGKSTQAAQPVPYETSLAAPSTQTPGSAAAHVPGAPLVFTPPSTWTVETPTNKMRAAQFRLPRAEGDTQDAACVVFFFGAMGGGGVEDNIDRWCGQFEQPDGRVSKDVLKRSERTVNGIPVHEVELSGTYVAETAPGSGVHMNEPGWRLLGAILESDPGPYFVKLTGPAKTVEARAGEFRAFISTVK